MNRRKALPTSPYCLGEEASVSKSPNSKTGSIVRVGRTGRPNGHKGRYEFVSVIVLGVSRYLPEGPRRYADAWNDVGALEGALIDATRPGQDPRALAMP